ncbi:uncharacterized protein LOC124348477 [Daphnia pulicaria]|uniref:uncharacterized protein LOC124348477 n=1 Tax=Daphnia pulicaria TaxID=35523 RepID=UPI001EEB2877|nr:uncharacterized protein LOC124348477 [Daphnia pulicaria]
MSNESTTERREFTRSNGIDFPQIRYATMLKLKVVRLENIVLGTDPKPRHLTKSALVLNIKLCVTKLYQGSVTAQEIWQRLLAEFADVAASNVQSPLGKFNSYRMNPDHKVTTHVNVFRQMAEELRGVRQPQSIDIIVSKIIQTLPPSYAVFETMWSGLPVADLTMANLTAKLSEEERKLNDRSKRNTV